jgi:uncharacterized OsmC-like protein
MSLFKTVRLTASARVEDGCTIVEEVRRAGPQWRGAELLVAAVAADYATELTSAAQRLGIPVEAVQVEASGHLTARRDDRYGLVAIELDAVVLGCAEECDRIPLAAEVALDRCIVAGALDVPFSHQVRAVPHVLEEAVS